MNYKLHAKALKFTLVTASVGCLPDNDPEEFDTLEEAKAALENARIDYIEYLGEIPVMDTNGLGFDHPGEYNLYRTYIEEVKEFYR